MNDTVGLAARGAQELGAQEFSAQEFTMAPPRRDSAERSSLSDLLRLMHAEDGITPLTDSQSVAQRRVRAGGTLFYEGGNAESIEFVRLGTFKVFTRAEDGSEQVVGFADRAEMLGFDALGTGRHPTAAVALEDSWVFSVRTPDLLEWCLEVPPLNRALHLASSRQLARWSELADVMAAVVAEIRLARFLVHLADHMQALGRSPRRFVLRMTRRDLASHLGVAHETVSRAFTALAHWGYLRVSVREVEILDIERLSAFARGTRGPLRDAAAPKRASRRPIGLEFGQHASPARQALQA